MRNDDTPSSSLFPSPQALPEMLLFRGRVPGSHSLVSAASSLDRHQPRPVLLKDEAAVLFRGRSVRTEPLSRAAGFGGHSGPREVRPGLW